MDEALKQAMQAKFESSGIPFEELKVFGSIRLNVHVVCLGRDTADKWASLLSQVVGGKIHLSQHWIDAKKNLGSCLNPTKRSGFLIMARG